MALLKAQGYLLNITLTLPDYFCRKGLPYSINPIVYDGVSN